MRKPKKFVSSTIYDFEDMRSALKYCGKTANFIKTNYNRAIRQITIEMNQLKISKNVQL